MAMQRVSSLLPSWDWNRSSVSSFSTYQTRNSADRVRGWADKIPAARLSRQIYPAVWPGTLDKECEKAARILKAFCSDGLPTGDERPGSPLTSSSNQSTIKVLKKIPPRLIQNAVGMAIFTSMRSGLWTSGSGGSGILIARKTDGSWSPPSGLVLQTPSLGFVIGVDIYDCVLLINNFTVLEAFARPKLTLGTDVALSGGPLVSMGLLENDVTWADLSDMAITYVKASGQFSEVKLEGTVIQERKEENERFYGMTLSVAKILSGDINQSLPQVRPLTEVLKAAEGRVDYDAALVESLSPPVPGDNASETSATQSPHVFGLPAADDPDPFGVVALEMAGVGIREAGSHLRPDSIHFEYHPNPTSPAYAKVQRGSVDTVISYSNRSGRASYISNRTAITEKSQTTDVCAPTFSMTPATTPPRSQSQSEDGHQLHSPDEVHETKASVEIDCPIIDISALRKLSNFPDLEEEPAKLSDNHGHDALSCASVELKTEKDDEEKTKEVPERSPSPVSSIDENKGDADDREDGDYRAQDRETDVTEDEVDSDSDDGLDDEDDEEEAVVIEVATAQAPARATIFGAQMMQAKGAVVNIAKRVPPPLPARSPARASRRRSQMPDVGDLVSSPLKNEFDPAEISDMDTPDTSNILEPMVGVEDEVSQTPDHSVAAKVSPASTVDVEDEVSPLSEHEAVAKVLPYYPTAEVEDGISETSEHEAVVKVLPSPTVEVEDEVSQMPEHEAVAKVLPGPADSQELPVTQVHDHLVNETNKSVQNTPAKEQSDIATSHTPTVVVV